MKKLFQLLLLALIVSFKSEFVISQRLEFNKVRISRVSYIHRTAGVTENQLLIDLDRNKVYFRKNPHRKFKEIQTSRDISIFKNQVNYSRMKEITTSVRNEQAEEVCYYHNEYGYYKVELLIAPETDEIYGESFLINIPNCKDQNDEILIRAYYDLIVGLLKDSR